MKLLSTGLIPYTLSIQYNEETNKCGETKLRHIKAYALYESELNNKVTACSKIVFSFMNMEVTWE